MDALAESSVNTVIQDEPSEYVSRFLSEAFAKHGCTVLVRWSASDSGTAPAPAPATSAAAAAAIVASDDSSAAKGDGGSEQKPNSLKSLILSTGQKRGVYWGQYDTLEEDDWNCVFSGRVFANVYCIRKGLIRKAQLASTLDEYFFKRQEVPRFHPVTEAVDLRPMVFSFGGASVDGAQVDVESRCEDILELMALPENKGKLWIAKPSLVDRAHAISVVSNGEELVEALEKHRDLMQWVVQEYVRDPLLVEGHKFHLRVYVLCVGDLDVYVFDDMLALLAPSKFSSSTESTSLADAGVHITNTCKHSGEAGFEEERFVRLFGSQTCGMSPEDVDKIKSGIGECTGHLFRAMVESGDQQGFMALENCCELFGVDFLVRRDGLRPVLLEVNAIPDLKNTGERLERVIGKLVRGSVDLAFSTWFSSSEAARGDEKGGIPAAGGEAAAATSREEEMAAELGFRHVFKNERKRDWGKARFAED